MEIRTPSQLAQFFKEKGAGISEIYRRIAEFTVSQYQVACFMNASELAMAVGVSQPSIARFISHLGFETYGQFSRVLQKIVLAELKAKDGAAVTRTGEAGPSAFTALLESEVANLRALADTLESDDFRHVVKEIAAARRVIVIGLRSARCLADYVGFFLNKVHPGVLTFTQAGLSIYDDLLNVESEGTVALALSFPRNTSEIAEIMDYIQGRRIPVFLVTDSYLSPLAAKADVLLRAPVSVESLFDCYSAPITLLNVLVRDVAQENPERSEAMLKAFEGVAEARGIFLR